MGKEWTTVGPDSEIKLVGVSAASTVTVRSVYVGMSVRGDRAQGRTYPHPGSIFFRNSHFSESLLPLKRHRGEPTHTHGTHGRTRAHESHRTQKNLTRPQLKNHPNSPTHPHDRTTARPREDRIRGRFNSRSPGAERSPRPTTGRYGPGSPGVFLPVQYRYCPVCVHPAPPGVFTGPGC